MILARLKKEIGEEDWKKLRKAGKKLPEFVNRRVEGSQMWVKEQDLKDYGEYIEKVSTKQASAKVSE